MKKKLNLKKETLAELAADDLVSVVAGAAESQSCPITYTCISCGETGCFNSFGCLTGKTTAALAQVGC